MRKILRMRFPPKLTGESRPETFTGMAHSSPRQALIPGAVNEERFVLRTDFALILVSPETYGRIAT